MTFYVYIMVNIDNRVLYIGMTNHLARRVFEHKEEKIEGFIKRYKLTKFVYAEEYSTAYEAISREKILKGWRRERKNELVETINPNWEDLSKTL